MTDQMHSPDANRSRRTVDQTDGTVDLFPTMSEDLIGMELSPDLLSGSFVRNASIQIPYGSHVPGGTNPMQWFADSNDGPWHPKGIPLPEKQNELAFTSEDRDSLSPSECDAEPMPSNSCSASHEPQSLADQFRLNMDLQQNWSQFSDQSPSSFVQSPQLHATDFTCETCHKVLKTNSEFQKHQQRHTQPHKCPVPGCPGADGFSKSIDLDRHVRSVHQQAYRSAICYRCTLQDCRHKDKLWPRADNFRAHIKRVHQLSFTEEELEQFLYSEPPENVLPEPPNAVNKAPEDVVLEPLHGSSTTPRDVLPEYLRASSHLPDAAPELLHPLSNSQDVVSEPLNAQSNYPEDVLTDTVGLRATDSDSTQNRIKPSDYDPTDSGYGSMPSLSNNQETLETAFNLPESKASATESDAGTVLSAATTMASETVQQSLTDVCEDIYRKLQPEVNPTRFMAMAGNLGELIKAFAIQIGLDKTDSMGPSIMYFVYKYHNDICALLKAMFMNEDGNVTESRQDRSGVMSVTEKMGKWHDESLREHATFPKEQFEGIDDLEDDELISTAEPSAYSNAIFKSSAYSWLVSTLKHHASLSYGDGRALTASEQIRQTVLKQLQSGKISKSRAPKIFEASFVLPRYWDTLKARLCRNVGPGPDVRLGDIVVLIASSQTNVQLSTVGQYMRHVWQDSGALLLNCFQDLVEGNVNGEGLTIRRLDALSIRVYSADTDIHVICNGSSYLISQCAAQLAWLSCATQSGPSDPIVYTPHLMRVAVAEFEVSQLEETAEKHNILAHIEIAGQLQSASIHQLVSVWGFPTVQRPQGFSGVEVPLTLIGTSSRLFFQESNDRPFLHIRGAIAYCVEWGNNIWLWHLVPSLGDTCICSIAESENPIWAATPRSFALDDFHRSRHVFGRCDERRRFSQYWDVRPTREEDTNSNRDGNRTMIEPPTLISMQSVFTTNHSTESDSIDLDLLSISSFSYENHETTSELHGDIAAIVRCAARELFYSFQQRLATTATPCDGYSTGNSSGTTAGSGQIAPDESANSGANPRKRTINDQDEEDGDASRQNRRPDKQSKIDESSSEHNFACPFWKFDRIKHQKCLHHKLVSSSRVKQHLKRKHTPQLYCQICFSIFTTEPELEQHVIQRSCERLPGAKLQGISPGQDHKLSRKPKSEVKLTEKQKWYQIWTIIFPDRPQPRSPYIDSQLSDYFASMQEHCQKYGPEILQRQIQSSGLLPYPNIDETQLLRSVLERGLDMICQSWMIAQQLPSSQGPVTPAYTQEHSSRGTLSSTTPSSSSVGLHLNFQGDIHTNHTTRTSLHSDIAAADSNLLGHLDAGMSFALTEPILPEMDASGTTQTHAPHLASNGSFSLDNTEISLGDETFMMSFEDLITSHQM